MEPLKIQVFEFIKVEEAPLVLVFVAPPVGWSAPVLVWRYAKPVFASGQTGWAPTMARAPSFLSTTGGSFWQLA